MQWFLNKIIFIMQQNFYFYQKYEFFDHRLNYVFLGINFLLIIDEFYDIMH
jgi:hypothetical protein